jgi:hypothetical protein
MRPLALLLLLGASAAASQSQPAPPVLRVDTFSGGSCAEGFCTRSRSLLFRDGVEVSEALDSSCFFRVVRERASSQAVAGLLTDLAEQRVGLLGGSCHLGQFLPNFALVSTVTWFGRNGRSSTFTVANDGPPGLECPAPVRAVLDALSRFAEQPLVEQRVETEILLPTPPGGSCDLGEPPPLPGF